MTTKTQHTPGPWYVLGPHPSVYVGPCVDGGCGGEYPEPPQYDPVCQVHWCPDYKTEATDEEMANARLIAAAPELLQALRDMVAAASGQPKSCGHEFDCVCPFEAARAAIRKAEGE